MKKTYGGFLGFKKAYEKKVKMIKMLAFGFAMFIACATVFSMENASAGAKVSTGVVTASIVLGGVTIENPTEEQMLLFKIESAVKEANKEGATKEELKAINDAIKELKGRPSLTDELKAEIVEMSKTVKAITERQPTQFVGNKSVADQLREFATNEKTKAKWEAFKAGSSDNLEIPLVLKTAGTMLESNALGGSSYLPAVEMIPGVNDIARAKPLIEQYANTSNTNSPVIVWVNKTNPEGTVVMLAEGDVKTLIDFNLGTETSTAKKAPGKIKVSTEMLDDFDFMAQEIEGELRYQVDNAVDDQLIAGTGLTVYLKGITEYAGGYILTTLETPTPKNSDAVIAGVTQIKSLNFQASHAFMNPIDYANMKLAKDENGQYITVLGMPLGVEVVESNKIPVGYLLVADMSKYVVRNYKGFTVTYGHTGDDFERNLVTVLGERRLHAYASDNNTGAFMYDTFANIKTALEPAP